MIVKEHINFERGLDPKDAMSIGDKHIRKINKICELIYNSGIEADEVSPNAVQYVCDEFNYPEFSNLTTEEIVEISDKYDEWLLNNKVTESYNFERGLDPKDAMQIGLMKSITIDTAVDIKSDGTIDTDEGGIFFLKYLKKHNISYKIIDIDGGNGGCPIIKYIGLKDDLKRLLKIQFGLSEYEIDDYLNESYNFERGLDPKRSMDIGQQRVLKNEAEKIDWDWDFKEYAWQGHPHH